MQRYFLKEKYSGQEKVIISGEDYHHLLRVMRMKEGDEFWSVFLDSETALVKITQITDASVEAKIIKWETVEKELPVFVAVASGLPKGDKLEWVIQKGTELGASEFIPFNAKRSVVKWDQKKAEKKVLRWEKIAKEAAEQAHRQKTPIIHPPIEFIELIQLGENFDWKILAYEEVAKTEVGNFSKILQKVQPYDKILFVFGPEGGISDHEKDLLEENGFQICGLGPRILRTETAPLYALSAVSYQFELMR